jgi:hypothetical protein
MTNEELFCATTLASWKLVLGRADGVMGGWTEEQMERRVAPGKNRLRYLLGHLTAVHDRLLPALGIGERMHAELDAAYVTNPDGALADPVSGEELKKAWREVNGKITAALEGWSEADWLERHTLVSAEDFAREPLRNRLALVLSRTNHLAFHSGQVVLVK